MPLKKQISGFLLLGLWTAIIFQSIPHAHHIHGEDVGIEETHADHHHHHFFSFLDNHNEDDATVEHTDHHKHYFHSHDYAPFTNNSNKELKSKQLFSFFTQEQGVATNRNYNYKFKYKPIRVYFDDNLYLLNHSLRAPPILG